MKGDTLNTLERLAIKEKKPTKKAKITEQRIIKNKRESYNKLEQKISKKNKLVLSRREDALLFTFSVVYLTTLVNS